MIPLMLDAIHAVNLNNPEAVAITLGQISEIIQIISKILQRMYEECGPAVFFHAIRPFLAGGKNMASAGLPNGVFYDLGDGHGKWHQYSGGSNAQSSLIQTFDAFLGVHHTATGETKSGTTDQESKAGSYLQVRTTYNFSPPIILTTNYQSRKCETTCPVPTAAS